MSDLAEVVFAKTLYHVLGIEGGYSHDPRDSGGETVFGISRKHWPQWPGWEIVDALKRLPDFHAAIARSESLKRFRRQFYKEHFWDKVNGDGVAALSPAIAAELFDIEVNCPPGLAARWLQEALNALNDPSGGREASRVLYPELAMDGRIGPATLAALARCLAVRKHAGESVLLRMLNVRQGAHYLDLAARREKDKAFVFGWFLRRIALPA